MQRTGELYGEALSSLTKRGTAKPSHTLCHRWACVQLEVSPEAKDLLGNLGYDPTYGARPLKRVIQRQLENPLAEAILSGEFGSGDTVVVGASPDGHLTLSRTAGEGPQPSMH